MDETQTILDLPGIELRHLLNDPDPTRARPRSNQQARNDPLPAETLDDWLVAAATQALENRAPVELEHAIGNVDRTIGARLSGEIAERYGDAGLPADTVRVKFSGSAGQSFGAFCISGMSLTLMGEANDYVGKGMAGGSIVVRPPLNARWATQDNFIAGNTLLYGATGGSLFAAGRVGERFAVRNCGANAVVEGVGDHGCEYMTSGTVVILGQTGRNFGAGMTGGVAYVYDHENKFTPRLNPQLVQAERITSDEDDARLRDLIGQHMALTESPWAKSILDNWDASKKQFWKVSPK